MKNKQKPVRGPDGHWTFYDQEVPGKVSISSGADEVIPPHPDEELEAARATRPRFPSLPQTRRPISGSQAMADWEAGKENKG